MVRQNGAPVQWLFRCKVLQVRKTLKLSGRTRRFLRQGQRAANYNICDESVTSTSFVHFVRFKSNKNSVLAQKEWKGKCHKSWGACPTHPSLHTTCEGTQIISTRKRCKCWRPHVSKIKSLFVLNCGWKAFPWCVNYRTRGPHMMTMP